jgi:hypothetical protein
MHLNPAQSNSTVKSGNFLDLDNGSSCTSRLPVHYPSSPSLLPYTVGGAVYVEAALPACLHV